MQVDQGHHPGFPGRGFDPVAAATPLQWYLYHQQNVVYYAAFTAHGFDRAMAVAALADLFALAPQLCSGYVGADGRVPGAAVLERIVGIETVAAFDGFPDRWLNAVEPDVTADPSLPMVRMRVANRSGGADAAGRAGFLLVRVSHALVEGTDSALLSRSRSAQHRVRAAATGTPGPARIGARAFAGFAAVMHLLVARLVNLRPGRIGVATRVRSREAMSALARRIGVSQRALFFALASHVILGSGTPAGKRRVSTTYSVVDTGGGGGRDAFMRMRMLFATYPNRPDFAEFARALETSLHAAEAGESGFNAEMNGAAVRAHRAMARHIPWAYSPAVFRFMPYDIVFALIPPHRLGGALTGDLLEPVYAGATMSGINGCVIVPGRRWVTFNFYLQEHLLAQADRFDTLLETLHGNGS